MSGARFENRSIHGVRLLAGYAISRHLLLVAGPSLNVQVAKNDDDRRPRAVDFADQVWTSGSYTVRMYPGFSAGLEF